MIGCMILEHTAISSLTMSKILRAMFHHRLFEIHAVKAGKTVMYIWDAAKEEVWQSVAQLEFAGITAGYGFAQSKKEAKQKAQRLLELRRLEEMERAKQE